MCKLLSIICLSLFICLEAVDAACPSSMFTGSWLLPRSSATKLACTINNIYCGWSGSDSAISGLEEEKIFKASQSYHEK